MSHWPRWILALLLLLITPITVAADYTVLIDSDNNAGTGCTVSSVSGVDYRVNVQLNGPPASVSQTVEQCQSGSLVTTARASQSAVGLNTGPSASDVIELGVDFALTELLINNSSHPARITLYGLANGTAGASDSTGAASLSLLVPSTGIPTLEVWALILLALGLATCSVFWLKRYSVQPLLLVLVLLACSGGLVWALNNIVVDGQVADWSGLVPISDDADNDSAAPNSEILALWGYYSTTQQRLFLRFDLADVENQAPTAQADSYSTNEDTLLNATTSVLNNDSDPDGNSALLTAQLVITTSNGVLNLANDGTFTYQPNANFSGTDSFTYKARDALSADSAATTVTITVNAINDAPTVTVPSAQTVDEDGSLSLSTANGNALSVADVDAGNGTLTLTLSVTNGVVNLASTTNLTAVTAGPAASIAYTGSLTDLSTALGAGVVYQPTAGYSGSDTLTVVIDDQGNSGTGGALNDSDTVAITVTAVNDAPTVTVPGAQSVSEDGSLSLSTANSNALSVADVDAGSGALTLTLSVTNGVVNLASTTNLTAVTAGPAASIEYTGSLTDLNAALGAGVVYQPTADYNGSDTLTVVIDDQGNSGTGGALNDSDTVAITVTAVNDAPTVTVPGAQAVNEDSPLSITSISVADVDAGNGTLTLTLSVTNGVVNLASTTNLTAVTAGPAASIAYTGSLTDLSTALGAGVVYQPTAGYSGSDTLTVVIDDQGNTGTGGALNDSDTVAITVTAVNDAPTVTVPSAQSVNEDGSLSLSTANSSAISVADVDASSGALTLTLSVTNGVVNLASTTNLTAVTAGPAASIEYTGSLTDLNAALGAGVVYQPTADYNGSDTLTVVIDDQGNSGTGGALNDSDTVAITVTAVNDAPTVTVPSAQTVDEDGSLSLSTANGNALSVADVDAGNGTLTLTLSVTNGVVNLASTTNLTAVTAGPAASIAYTGNLTDLSAALGAGVVYQPTAGYSGSDTLTVVIDDQGNSGTGGALNDSATVAITVTAVNDAPTVTVPGAQSVSEDGSLSLSTANSNALSVADVDAGSGALTLTLSVTNGVVNLASTTNLTAVTAGPAASIEYTGSLADLNAALGAGVVYQPTADYNGSDTLTVVIDDQGNTGTGGALTDSDTVAITVTAVNDAPTVTVPGAQSANEDGSLSLSTANSSAISVADVDAGSGALKLTLSVSNGVVSLASTTNLTAVTAGPAANIEYTGSVTDLNAALGAGVVYQPTAGYSGSDTLTVAIDDQGNTGTGGALTDSDTVAITVTAVNDAPTVTVPSAQSVNEDGSLSLSTANSSAISVADVDASSGALKLTLSVSNGVVSLASTTNLTAVTAGPAASIEYTGSVTDLNAALGAGVVYQPTAGYSGSDTLTVTIDDQGNTGTGGAQTDSDTVAITVTAVNDAPTVTVPGAQTVDEGKTLTLSTANSSAISVADVDAASGVLKLTLSVTNGTVNLASTTNLTAVTAGPAASIEYTGSLADLNAALGAGVLYQSTAGYSGSDTLTAVIDDQGNTGTGGALNDSDTVAITVTAINDAPTVTVPSAQTVNEDTPLGITGISVADVDAGSGALKLTLSVSHGTVSLASTSGLTAEGAFTPPAASISYSGTLSALNTALASVNYQGDANYNGSDTLTVVIDDQGNTGTGGALNDSDTVAITVTAVNDAPTVSVPSAQSVDEDTLLSITGISVADVDVASGTLKLTLSVDHGTVSLANTSGLTAVGVFTPPAASISYTGTLSAINTALTSLSYQGVADYNGSDTLTVAIDDQGNTGGGAQTDSDTVAITVIPVNDAPRLLSKSYSVLANTGISVPDGVDDLLAGAVEVESEGIVLSALTVSPHNAGIVNASAGSFTFKPQAGFTGTANLTYSACDTHTPTAACSTANLTVTVSGPVVWYVNPAVTGPGTGTLSDPFKLLSAAQTASSANHAIFLDGGTHTTGITLKAGQKLIGDGATGSFDVAFGYSSIPSYTDARPVFGGTRPVVQGTVQLSTSNTASDFNITPASGAKGLVGVGSTSMNVSNMNITTSTNTALDISAGSSGSVTLGAVQTTGGSSGVLLAGSNLTLAVGSTTVNNVTGNALGISSMNGALTFNNTNVNNAGSSAISVTNTQGQLAFNSCTINGNIGATRSVDVSLSSGTLSLLKFDNCDVTRTTLGGTAIAVNLPSGSTATVSDLQVINGSALTNHNTALEVYAQGSSRISSLTVLNSNLNGQSTGLDLAARGSAEIQALNVSGSNLTGSATTSINAYATDSAKIGTVAGNRSISSNTTATSNANKIVNWIHSETAATPAPMVLGLSNNTVSSFGDSGFSIEALGGKSSIDVHLLNNTIQGDLSNIVSLAGMYLGVGNTDSTATDRLCAKVLGNRITITNAVPNGIYLSPDGANVKLYIDGLGAAVVETFLGGTNTITVPVAGVPVFAAGSINSATCVVP